ncbi:MAG: glycerol kinase GlpK [Bacteroidota bacterium]
MKEFILALDQGTSSSRAAIFDKEGSVLGLANKAYDLIFPKSGWVEQNPEDIWSSQMNAIDLLFEECSIDPEQIAAIGITNQRETSILWDKTTGKAIYNAIVWQDRRTAAYCRFLEKNRLGQHIKSETGLLIDPYFSGTKLRWILENVEGARELANRGRLLFGTVDAYLLWKMTGGKEHATDVTNASRTMLFNIHALEWDKRILEVMDIPRQLLPEVKMSTDEFGTFAYKGNEIPIKAIAGDQHAALFGQVCFEEGMAKNTYGTGCFMLMNTGEDKPKNRGKLLNTIAWGINSKVSYAVEGSVFIAGAAVQWLRDGLSLIDSVEQTEKFALESRKDSRVVLVPAFTGLGAPYWDSQAKGAIYGLEQNTGRPELIRATLESLAFQSRDLIDLMENESGYTLRTLKVDGGASSNNFLMQFQADILGKEVIRPAFTESTVFGIAAMVGISLGFWSQKEISSIVKTDRIFSPMMEDFERENRYANWKSAVSSTMAWKGKAL